MMRRPIVIGGAAFAVLLAAVIVRTAFQAPTVRALDERALREYVGVYQWDANAFLYLQLWNEFTGFANPGQLVAFDESGDVRTLYPTPDDDRFFAGPGAADPSKMASRVEFQRDSTGKLVCVVVAACRHASTDRPAR